jgi:hypothetical protein
MLLLLAVEILLLFKRFSIAKKSKWMGAMEEEMESLHKN